MMRKPLLMVISGGETQHSAKGAMKRYLYNLISVTDEVLNENAEYDFLQYVPPVATQMPLSRSI